MIRTLYRRPDAPTTPAAAFEPLPATDPLFGAVPTWRLEEDPPGWLETIADLGDPTAVRVDVVVVDDAPPTAALQLVPREEALQRLRGLAEEGFIDPGDVEPLQLVEDVVVLECPDCHVRGNVLPCRPKGDPVDGRPLTRWHRRRRALVEHRDTGSAASWTLFRIAAAAVLVVLAVLAFGQAGGGDERGILVPSSRVPSPCPAGTAPGCPDGPRP